jgi:general secretion pathway protein F
MPIFRYSAYDARGELAEGTIDAISADAASEMLWSRGLSSFHLKAEMHSEQRWWQREILSAKKNRQIELALFTREFATLLAAEIPLDDILRILCDQPASIRMSKLVTSLRADVLAGLMLSEAMQKHSQIFPLDYISMASAGEAAGTIAEVFRELAEILERRMEIRAKIRSALIYPILLMGFAVICLVVIIGALIPSIAAIFATSNKPMPETIRTMMRIQENWLAILIGVLAAISITVCLSILALRQSTTRHAFDRLKLKTPLFGSFILQQETARFARTLGTLLRAGVPLLQASSSACRVLRNRHTTFKIENVIAAIREGSSLHRALEHENIFPVIAIRMISVGEGAGRLEQMLLRLAAILEQQTQQTIDRAMTMLTPLLTTAMAVLIGGLIITVMDAVLSVNSLAFQ